MAHQISPITPGLHALIERLVLTSGLREALAADSHRLAERIGRRAAPLPAGEAPQPGASQPAP
ncbi:MAG: hypothetical protein ACK41U_13965 [Paracoccus sp. (in: a-proteobacteria)]|uniref:hypothetical protein n=1 Tax=Paracoccus sp. TaxID=267 RepID=UPI0039198825